VFFHRFADIAHINVSVDLGAVKCKTSLEDEVDLAL